MGSTNDANQSTKHAEEGKEGTNKSGTSLGLGLECQKGIELGCLNEGNDARTDEADRVSLEGNGVLFIIIRPV